MPRFDLSSHSAAAVADALGVAVLLAACGGFLDAFTYVGPSHVFATAMSGNVVLFGVSAATGKWNQAINHLRPILAFLLGVAVTQVLNSPWFPKRTPRAPVAAVTLEILFLLVVGCFPKDFANTFLVNAVSFVAAIQSSTFQKARKWNYASTMTTGNLRNFAEALFQSALGTRDPDSAERARTYGAVSVAFLTGTVIGALCAARLDNRALWIADLLLLAVWIRLVSAFLYRPRADAVK